MKIFITFFLTFLFFTSCAYHSAYDTTRLRDREYRTNQITLTEGGLSSDQIKTITSTKLPTTFPVDLSIILVKNGYIDNETEQLFMKNVIESLKSSDKINRIVPIPKFLIPANINFSVIQELGIRTLTEYVILLVVDAQSFFNYTKIIETQFRITSAVDFILVDPQTTAILTSDRIFSEKLYNENLFKTGEKQKAKEEIFSEQGELLGKSIAELFK
jgi:hypothetical protein